MDLSVPLESGLWATQTGLVGMMVQIQTVTYHCDNEVLNNLDSSDIRPAYYVLESINRLHTYFTGLSEAFSNAALDAALSKDDWATTFYRDKDDKSDTVLKEVLNAAVIIVGIGSALSGFGETLTGVLASAASTIYSGSVSATSAVLATHQDDTFEKSADLGGILSAIIIGALESFTSISNNLMAGDTYNGSDISIYLQGGAFLSFEGVDKNAVTNAMTNMLIGASINELWRTQKIFIMGGGACGDGQGIGEGPQDAVVCRDNKAGYLYYWQEDSSITLSMHQWGWTASPPGATDLGSDPYGNVTIEDVINSSLDSYNAGGFNYTTSNFEERTLQAILNATDVSSKGAALEGIFTIPVCDVSGAIDSDYHDKQYILQPYGKNKRPVWCGSICSGDLQTTKDFIQAANMHNFQSPKHLCPEYPGY